MVSLSEDTDLVFPTSILTTTARTIVRPRCPGFTILDGGSKDGTMVQIQPSAEAFKQTFSTMTGDILKGLEWDNVFVAGGMALGCLLCVDTQENTSTPAWWDKSDIDVFLYGLTPLQAIEKVKHIYKIFKSNLPPDEPTFAVRNCRTITLYSTFPIRRVQIILKIVPTPKDVLLGFDLDICKVGWDGKELWMLPRCARAIESTFSMRSSLRATRLILFR